MVNDTLYIFIDESGDFTFSSKGSQFFILTSISTLDPLSGRGALLKLKYELLKDGFDKEYFHASEDEQIVRDKVYEIIKSLNNFEIDSVIAQKNKANLTLYQNITADPKKVGFTFKIDKVEERFYKQICETLLQYNIRRYLKMKSNCQIEKVVVILDRVFFSKKREYITKHIKQYMKTTFGMVPYVLFHQMKSDPNCQIADYCCWAIAVKHNRQETRPYRMIQDKITSEFDLFQKGTNTYY